MKWYTGALATTNMPGETHKLISMAIKSEKAAIEKYSRQLNQIQDDGIYIALQQIILDEQSHVEILTKLYRKYSV